jgi:deoxyribodipyrimidine photolyase-related protein
MLDGHTLPTTADDSERLWCWAKSECLPTFGPYEDAMSEHSSGLFHTRVSALLNLQRLSAQQLVDEALALAIDLPSKEGFLRQIAGWREYMRHVHRATDGFCELPAARATSLPTPGDGGYARWAGAPWPAPSDGDGGSNVSQLAAEQPLPPAYWGRESGLHCLDSVVKQVWSEGYSHHITRLMVLANFAMLLDVSPRELTDWFWVAYVDAYDWVVEPNVLAMGTFGTGDLITTKPYIAGAAYIDRMSDFCKSCRFDPRKNCPFTPLYWAFLARHADALQDVARMDMPLRSVATRSAELRERDQLVLAWVQRALSAGATLRVEDVPS